MIHRSLISLSLLLAAPLGAEQLVVKMHGIELYRDDKYVNDQYHSSEYYAINTTDEPKWVIVTMKESRNVNIQFSGLLRLKAQKRAPVGAVQRIDKATDIFQNPELFIIPSHCVEP